MREREREIERESERNIPYINMALKNTAPHIPNFRTLGCLPGRILKCLKMSNITNKLSTERLFSTRYPVAKVNAVVAPLEIQTHIAKIPAAPIQKTVHLIASLTSAFELLYLRSNTNAMESRTLKRTHSVLEVIFKSTLSLSLSLSLSLLPQSQ